MLAAGLLTAGTVLTTAGAASAAATAVHRANCTNAQGFLNVSAGGVNYFLGTPNKIFNGATALLKPRENSTTLWTACSFSGTNVTVLTNRGLALTSRATTPGADVTLTPTGNSGNGFASQQWDYVDFGTNSVTFQNVKTGLYLRVRNSGPIMRQTVTTGSTSTAWTATAAAGTFAGHR